MKSHFVQQLNPILERIRFRRKRVALPPEQGDISQVFRQEVAAARADSWFGRPQVVAPLGVRLIASIMTGIVIVIILFLVFGSYTRRTTIGGVVLPVGGLSRVIASQPGRITEQGVVEGQEVSQGEMIYVIDVDSVSNIGKTQKTVTDELKRQRSELESERQRRNDLDAMQKRDLERQAADGERELALIEKQIASSSEYMKSLGESLARYKVYIQKQIVVQGQVDSKEQAFMSTRQQLQSFQRDQVQLSTNLSKIRLQLESADNRTATAQSELVRQIAQIDQTIAEGEAKRFIRLTAPRNGIVTGLNVKAGELIVYGTPLATIVPKEEHLQIWLAAPSSAIGFLKEGQSVMIRYEAFPYQKFGQYPGTVRSVSQAALRANEFDGFNTIAAAQAQTGANGQNFYRIIVEPERYEISAYGKRQKLRAGMQVEATIFLDKRPLYQWVLDPLFSLGKEAGTAPSPIPQQDIEKSAEKTS